MIEPIPEPVTEIPPPGSTVSIILGPDEAEHRAQILSEVRRHRVQVGRGTVSQVTIQRLVRVQVEGEAEARDIAAERVIEVVHRAPRWTGWHGGRARRRRYSAAERAAIVADAASLGVTEAAERHGVPQSTLSTWLHA